MADSPRRQTVGVVSRVIGLTALALAVVLGFAVPKGWLGYGDRRAFLEWAIQSDAALPADSPPARVFMARFPPSLADRRLVTHVTIWRTSFKEGPMIDASFTYIRRDQSRTEYVATLPQVREWAAESPYGWLPWTLTVLGFIALLGDAVVGLGSARRSGSSRPPVRRRVLHS